MAGQTNTDRRRSLGEQTNPASRRPAMIQTLRVMEQVFLPDSELRRLLNLGPTDIILRVERKQSRFHLKGQDRGQALDLEGCIVTVYRGEK